jgi:hypothetical protein
MHTDQPLASGSQNIICYAVFSWTSSTLTTSIPTKAPYFVVGRLLPMYAVFKSLGHSVPTNNLNSSSVGSLEPFLVNYLSLLAISKNMLASCPFIIFSSYKIYTN